MLKHNNFDLKFGGKVRPFAFDFNFFKYLTEEEDLAAIDEIQIKAPWDFLPKLAYAALRSGADMENKKDKFSLEEVSRWVQDVEDTNDLNKMVESYRASLGFTYRSIYGAKAAVEVDQSQEQSQSQESLAQ